MAGEVFRKAKWSGVENQTPIPRLEIFTPRFDRDAGVFVYDHESPAFVYGADAQRDPYACTKILAYSFTEAVDDLSGSFGFTVEDEEVDAEGRTVFDFIPERSVVKIYEGRSPRPVFVGIVRKRHLGMSMTSQGVKRTVVFNGKSIISVIAEFAVSLDVRIHNVGDPTVRTKELTAALSRENPLSIKRFMELTWGHFKAVSISNTGISTAGLLDLINKFILGDEQGNPDASFIKVSGRELYLRYNIAMPFYNAANNVIADTWRNILPERAYEFFSRCEKGRPRIIARQVPFGDPNGEGDFGDWSDLPLYVISPISLTDFALDRSDEEIYTAFSSHIVGASRDRMFFIAATQGGPDAMVRHSHKQELYGFRPLELTFNGYARRGNEGNAEMPGITQAIKELNAKAYYWYSRLDEMYSGAMTLCADFDNPENNPLVGCRVKFKGGEFYVTKTERTWIYGGTPTIKLTVSRGMVYDERGKMREGDAGILRNVGRRMRELDREEKSKG